MACSTHTGVASLFPSAMLLSTAAPRAMHIGGSHMRGKGSHSHTHMLGPPHPAPRLAVSTDIEGSSALWEVLDADVMEVGGCERLGWLRERV